MRRSGWSEVERFDSEERGFGSVVSDEEGFWRWKVRLREEGSKEEQMELASEEEGKFEGIGRGNGTSRFSTIDLPGCSQ